MKILRIALVLGVFLILTTMVVSADAPYHPGPATFLPYGDCWIFDADFKNLETDPWYYVEDCSPTISLITNNKEGVFHWHAQAQLPEGAALPEKEAVHFTYENSGFACWWDELGEVTTTNYSITITPKGKFIISCHFRPDKWQPE